MKLTTVLLAGVFAVGSTAALADHRHKHGHHHKHRHHATCKHKVIVHKPVVVERYRVPRTVRYRNDHRNHYYDDSYARVISVEPVYRFVSVPVTDRSCANYNHRRSGYNSHTATVLGAVIGGALGHRIGDAHGDPKAAAIAGGVLGASFGRDLDRHARSTRGLHVDGPCQVTERVETRRELVEYEVTYRYNGRVHSTRMDYDPGEWVKLDGRYTPA